VVNTLQRVYREEGPARLFSGLGPRVMWIGIGGFVFFGVYEDCRLVFRNMGL
jgi:solute carrier family 25 S-adenosylmethionine transporter 26